MPTIYRVKGYRFFFFSNEIGELPHIHIESAENYAKFWLDTIDIARNIGYNERELNAIRKIIEQQRDFFMRSWNDYFNKRR